MIPRRQNPKQVGALPMEVSVATERLDREAPKYLLGPGVWAVQQISATGERAYILNNEAREFVYCVDAEGRGCYFYRSFAGTGGKIQGVWYPTGGTLHDVRDQLMWVVKGNPKKDPGAGRPPLLAFVERVNEVLPHSDAETDAWVQKIEGVNANKFFHYRRYEIRPTFRLLVSVNEKEASEWRGWCYDFWALNGLTRYWGPRVATNPAAQPSASLAATSVYRTRNEQRFVLWDIAQRGQLRGYGRAVAGPHGWSLEEAYAQEGYGPLLYAVGAQLVGEALVPSLTRSAEAERFWARQPGRRVEPLSRTAFQARFGVPLTQLLENGRTPCPALSRWVAEAHARIQAAGMRRNPVTTPDYERVLLEVYKRYSAREEELLDVALEAVNQAQAAWDATKGTSFRTFAWELVKRATKKKKAKLTEQAQEVREVSLQSGVGGTGEEDEKLLEEEIGTDQREEEARVEKQVEQSRTQKALTQMEPRHRVLAAWIAKGYNIPQAARAMHVSESTARRWQKELVTFTREGGRDGNTDR